MLDISQLADFLSSLPVRQLCGLILLLFKSFHFFNWDDFLKGASGYFVSFSFKDCLRLHCVLPSPWNSSQSPRRSLPCNLIKYLANLARSYSVCLAGCCRPLQSAAVRRVLTSECLQASCHSCQLSLHSPPPSLSYLEVKPGR